MENQFKTLVKPLKWERISDRTIEAVGLNLNYRVQTLETGKARWQSKYMGTWYNVESVDIGMAEAQAHHEKQVLSWLV